MGLLDDVVGMARMTGASAQPQQDAGVLGMLLNYLNSPQGGGNQRAAADVPAKGTRRDRFIVDRHGAESSDFRRSVAERLAWQCFARHRGEIRNGYRAAHFDAFSVSP